MNDFINQIHEFLDSEISKNKKLNSQKWIESDTIKLYIRYTPQRFINEKLITTIDIAAISIAPRLQGKGIFTNILESIETKYSNIPIFVESIENQRLYNWLIKRGYKLVQNTTNCVISNNT